MNEQHARTRRLSPDEEWLLSLADEPSLSVKRRQVWDRAAALGWPRVTLTVAYPVDPRRKTDTLGPGAVAFGLFCEQATVEQLAEAWRQLNR